MTMTTKDLIKSVLEKWGFPVLQDQENSVVFRYQMNFVQANAVGGDEDNCVVLTLCGIFSAEDASQMYLGLNACNDLNCNLLQVKLYIDSEADLVIASEFFYQTADDMEFLLAKSLQGLVVAKKRFRLKMEELEEEARLAAELEQEGEDQE